MSEELLKSLAGLDVASLDPADAARLLASLQQQAAAIQSSADRVAGSDAVGSALQATPASEPGAGSLASPERKGPANDTAEAPPVPGRADLRREASTSELPPSTTDDRAPASPPSSPPASGDDGTAVAGAEGARPRHLSRRRRPNAAATGAVLRPTGGRADAAASAPRRPSLEGTDVPDTTTQHSGAAKADRRDKDSSSGSPLVSVASPVPETPVLGRLPVGAGGSGLRPPRPAGSQRGPSYRRPSTLDVGGLSVASDATASAAHVDIAILHSSPLVVKRPDGQLLPVEPLDARKEQSLILRTMEESQRAITAAIVHATVDTLRRMLDRGCSVIHFTGHGGFDPSGKDYLVFENRKGAAHLLGVDALAMLLRSGSSRSTNSLRRAASRASLRRTSVSSVDDHGLPPAEATSSPVGGPPVFGFQFGLSSGRRNKQKTPVTKRSSSATARDTASDGVSGGGGDLLDLSDLSDSEPGGDDHASSLGPLQLVFVASCHSRRVGEIFVNAGVRFVVCVRREERVLDRASATFARAFYHALLTGHSIRQSFDIAKARVASDAELPAEESAKFLLLVHPSVREAELRTGSEDLALFADIEDGQWVDRTVRPQFRRLPSRVEHFVGRRDAMFELVTLLMRHRLVTVRGAPGIGKTTLCNQVAHFLTERSAFADGAVFVSFRGVFSLESLLSAIVRELAPSSGQGGASSGGGGGNMGRSAESDGSSGSRASSADYATVDRILGDAELLLVLDNVEDPLNAAPRQVRDWLGHVLEVAPRLTLLITSRQSVGGGLTTVAEHVYTLDRLGRLDAARLFARRCPRQLTLRELFPQDYVDTPTSAASTPNSLATPPLGGVDSGGGHTQDNGAASSSVSGTVAVGAPVDGGVPVSRRGSRTPEEALKALSDHPLLTFLDGHPQAIALATPLLQDRSLAELSELVNRHGVDQLAVVDIPEDERSAVNTLVTSLQVSVDHLRKRNPDAVAFFALMGLLPGGALACDFDGIWSEGAGIVRVTEWSRPSEKDSDWMFEGKVDSSSSTAPAGGAYGSGEFSGEPAPISTGGNQHSEPAHSGSAGAAGDDAGLGMAQHLSGLAAAAGLTTGGAGSGAVGLGRRDDMDAMSVTSESTIYSTHINTCPWRELAETLARASLVQRRMWQGDAALSGYVHWLARKHGHAMSPGFSQGMSSSTAYFSSFPFVTSFASQLLLRKRRRQLSVAGHHASAGVHGPPASATVEVGARQRHRGTGATASPPARPASGDGDAAVSGFQFMMADTVQGPTVAPLSGGDVSRSIDGVVGPGEDESDAAAGSAPGDEANAADGTTQEDTKSSGSEDGDVVGGDVDGADVGAGASFETAASTAGGDALPSPRETPRPTVETPSAPAPSLIPRLGATSAPSVPSSAAVRDRQPRTPPRAPPQGGSSRRTPPGVARGAGKTAGESSVPSPGRALPGAKRRAAVPPGFGSSAPTNRLPPKPARGRAPVVPTLAGGDAAAASPSSVHSADSAFAGAAGNTVAEAAKPVADAPSGRPHRVKPARLNLGGVGNKSPGRRSPRARTPTGLSSGARVLPSQIPRRAPALQRSRSGDTVEPSGVGDGPMSISANGVLKGGGSRGGIAGSDRTGRAASTAHRGRKSDGQFSTMPLPRNRSSRASPSPNRPKHSSARTAKTRSRLRHSRHGSHDGTEAVACAVNRSARAGTAPATADGGTTAPRKPKRIGFRELSRRMATGGSGARTARTEAERRAASTAEASAYQEYWRGHRRVLASFGDAHSAFGSVLHPLEAMRADFMFRCARHFAYVAEYMFQHIGTLSQESQLAYTLLEIHEANLWGVLGCEEELRELHSGGCRDDADTEVGHEGLDLTLGEVPALTPRAAEMFGSPEGGARPAKSFTKVGSSDSLSPGYCVPLSVSAGVACMHAAMLATCFAQCLLVVHRLEDGVRAAEAGLRLACAVGDDYTEANLRKALGCLLFRQKHFDRAKTQLGHARALYKSLGLLLGQACAWGALGDVHACQGNLHAAYRCTSTAADLLEESGHADSARVVVLRRLASLTMKLPEKKAEATKLYAEARRLQGKLNRRKLARQSGRPLPAAVLPPRITGDLQGVHLIVPGMPPPTITAL